MRAVFQPAAMAPALLPAGHHASIYECRVRHRPWEQLQLGSTDSSFPFAVCFKDSSKRLRSTRSCTSPTQALPLAEVLYSCRYSALLPKDSSAQLRSARHGSGRFGSVLSSSLQHGSVRFCSVWSVQLGSVPFGSLRSVRVGSVQLSMARFTLVGFSPSWLSPAQCPWHRCHCAQSPG